MGLFRLLLSVLGTAVRLVEQLLFVLVQCYDKYIYSPLQTGLWPIVEKIPRYVKMNGKTHTIFSANIVSWARTVLVIPVAYCLRYNLCVSAFFLIIFHDFLDHLDGIVAKVHRQVYGQVDDPLLGGFMDAFCDKIVNVLALWSIVIVTDFASMSWLQSTILLSACGIIIAYEFILGVVRVQDYFHAYYLREYKKSDHGQSSPNIAAVMEGKLKEKLESMGIACLCLAQTSPVLMSSTSGIIGVVCLVLSLRLAHASLMHKLSARTENIRPSSIKKISTILQEANSREKGEDEQNEDHGWRSTGTQVDMNTTLKSTQKLTDQIMKKSPSEEKIEMCTLHRRLSLPLTHLPVDARVDKVYTVGCFDLFHRGHICLLQRMRAFGKQVIVGVHDSRSIYALKKRVPINSTEKRMLHVKQHADIVFCVAGTDPTNFIHCIFDKTDGLSGMYIRGDDMINFPAWELCESLMPIKFLPYTEGVSSTKLRKDMYNSSHWDSRFDDINLFY